MYWIAITLSGRKKHTHWQKSPREGNPAASVIGAQNQSVTLASMAGLLSTLNEGRIFRICFFREAQSPTT